MEQYGVSSGPTQPEQINVEEPASFQGDWLGVAVTFLSVSGSESALQFCMSSFPMEPAGFVPSISEPHRKKSNPS